MFPLRDPLQSHSRATDAQLIGESFYFCKQTPTHASASSSSFIATPSSHLPILLLPSLYLSICLPVPGSLYLTRSLPPSIPWPFSASVSSLSVDCLKAHCHSALAKINNIILIQTDIKRQRASKPFLCRLIMSPCFSTPFIFSRLVPSIFSLEDSSGFQLPGMSEQSLDVTFDADKFGRVAVCPRAPVSDISRLCDKYLRYWHTKVLLLQHGEKHALNVILIFHKLSQE